MKAFLLIREVFFLINFVIVFLELTFNHGENISFIHIIKDLFEKNMEG